MSENTIIINFILHNNAHVPTSLSKTFKQSNDWVLILQCAFAKGLMWELTLELRHGLGCAVCNQRQSVPQYWIEAVPCKVNLLRITGVDQILRVRKYSWNQDSSLWDVYTLNYIVVIKWDYSQQFILMHILKDVRRMWCHFNAHTHLKCTSPRGKHQMPT